MHPNTKKCDYHKLSLSLSLSLSLTKLRNLKPNFIALGLDHGNLKALDPIDHGNHIALRLYEYGSTTY